MITKKDLLFISKIIDEAIKQDRAKRFNEKANCLYCGFEMNKESMIFDDDNTYFCCRKHLLKYHKDDAEQKMNNEYFKDEIDKKHDARATQSDEKDESKDITQPINREIIIQEIWNKRFENFDIQVKGFLGQYYTTDFESAIIFCLREYYTQREKLRADAEAEELK